MGDTYKDKALALFNAGFEPIPLNGKKPVVKDWTNVRIDREQVEKWAANGTGNCNVGIRCTEYVHAIDIDIDDEHVAFRVREKLRLISGFTLPPVRVGKHPRSLTPCHIEGVTGKLSSPGYVDRHGVIHKIEILAKGQQFVSDGTHPDTGMDYEWQNARLETIGVKGLPVYSLEQIQDELFTVFDEEARKRGLKPVNGERDRRIRRAPNAPLEDDAAAQALANLKTPGASLEELKRALFALPMSYCDDREYWVEAGMIIHWETRGGEAGYRLYDAWSRLSDKYKSPQDTRERWNSFRLNRDPEQTATFGTLKAWLENEQDASDVDVTTVTEVTEVTDVAECNNTFEKVTDVTESNSCYSENVTIGRSKYDRVTAELWGYIKSSEGEVSTTMIYNELSLKTAAEKTAVRVALTRLCERGKLKKVPMKRGYYMPVETDIQEMNLGEAEKAAFPLPLPFDLSKHVKVLVGSAMVVSGTTNAGKTTFAFQCVDELLRLIVTFFGPTPERESAYALPEGSEECVHSEWFREFATKSKPVRYLNSEMSEGEILARIEAMGPESAERLKNRVQWVRRSYNWEGAIDPDGVNVIDYLQIYDEFYKIGQIISDVQQELRHGIAIILIQKKTGEANPRGGEFALERCRLAINLDANPSSGGGTCTLRKVKAPVDYLHNPQGMELDYKLGENMRLEATSKLKFLNKKERAAINRRYEEERRAKEAANDFFDVARKDNDEEIPF